MTEFESTLRHLSQTVSMVAGAALLAASFGQTATAAEVPAAAKKLIAGAQAEGKLRMVWGSTSLGGGKGAKTMGAAFNKHYGTSIRFQHTPGPNFSAIARKIAQQQNAGKVPFSDLGIAGPGQVGFYLRDKSLKPVNWRPLLPHIPKGVLKEMVSTDGSLIAFHSKGEGIMYNTNKIKPADAPKTLAAVLNPKWKGKVASTPYASGFGALGDHRDWGKEKTLAYARKLTANLGGLMGCGEYDRITSAEFWIFVVSCSPGRIHQLIDKGAPVAHNVPLDVLHIAHWFMGVTKGATSPKAATLFLAWLLTPEGQNIQYSLQGGDLNYLPGSKTAKVLNAAAKEAGKPLKDLTVHVLLNSKTPKLQRTVGKMFREIRKKK